MQQTAIIGKRKRGINSALQVVAKLSPLVINKVYLVGRFTAREHSSRAREIRIVKLVWSNPSISLTPRFIAVPLASVDFQTVLTVFQANRKLLKQFRILRSQQSRDES